MFSNFHCTSCMGRPQKRPHAPSQAGSIAKFCLEASSLIFVLRIWPLQTLSTVCFGIFTRQQPPASSPASFIRPIVSKASSSITDVRIRPLSSLRTDHIQLFSAGRTFHPQNAICALSCQFQWKEYFLMPSSYLKWIRPPPIVSDSSFSKLHSTQTFTIKRRTLHGFRQNAKTTKNSR